MSAAATLQKKAAAYLRVCRWLNMEEGVTGTAEGTKWREDLLFHASTGVIHAVRNSDLGVVFVATDGVNDGHNPSSMKGAHLIQVALNGEATPKGYRTMLWKWDPALNQHTTYLNPEPPPDKVTWEVPAVTLIPCPHATMLYGVVDQGTVAFGTRAEYDRLKRVIASRSKAIPADGKLPYYTQHLVEVLGSEDPKTNLRGRLLSLGDLNRLRGMFDLGPFPPLESPRAGLALGDLPNLVSLAK